MSRRYDAGPTDGRLSAIRRKAARKAAIAKKANGTFDRIRQAEAETSYRGNFPGALYPDNGNRR